MGLPNPPCAMPPSFWVRTPHKVLLGCEACAHVCTPAHCRAHRHCGTGGNCRGNKGQVVTATEAEGAHRDTACCGIRFTLQRNNTLLVPAHLMSSKDPPNKSRAASVSGAMESVESPCVDCAASRFAPLTDAPLIESFQGPVGTVGMELEGRWFGRVIPTDVIT